MGEGLTTQGTGQRRGYGTVLYLDCSSGYVPVCVCQNLELHTKKSDSYCTQIFKKNTWGTMGEI